MTRTIRKCAIGAVVLVGSWYGMQLMHEFGHVLGAIVSGGQIRQVRFPWLGFSSTEVAPNPNPTMETWAGPIVGVLAPMLVLAILWNQTRAIRLCALFFAGFCLIANGAYLGIGAFTGAGDAGELLRTGSPRWVLIAFGVISAPLGLLLWHIASRRRPKSQAILSS